MEDCCWPSAKDVVSRRGFLKVQTSITLNLKIDECCPCSLNQAILIC